MEKGKYLRLRGVCALCRSLKKRTADCKHQAFYFLPKDMRVSELPAHLQLEVNPKR